MRAAARLSPLAYFGTGAAIMLAGLALVWAWVAMVPMAFLDPEYPSFLAKEELLQTCDLGSLLVVGDSRAAADIIASRLPVRAANLAVGGGGPIEAFYLLRRALGCGQKPARIVLSLNAAHFTQVDTFWERSVRFGLIDSDDLADFLGEAASFGDTSFDRRLADGLPGFARAWLYTARFPSLYFANLLRTGGFLRYWSNQHVLSGALEARGQYFFGTRPGSSAVAAEAALRTFTPRPLLDHFLDRLLALAEENAIPVRFVAMPVNESTWRASDPAVGQAFGAFLAGHAARHPGFLVSSAITPHWPDRYFGDGFSHLNPSGAALLTERLADCLRDAAGAATACEPSWDDGRSVAGKD